LLHEQTFYINLIGYLHFYAAQSSLLRQEKGML